MNTVKSRTSKRVSSLVAKAACGISSSPTGSRPKLLPAAGEKSPTTVNGSKAGADAMAALAVPGPPASAGGSGAPVRADRKMVRPITCSAGLNSASRTLWSITTTCAALANSIGVKALPCSMISRFCCSVDACAP